MERPAGHPVPARLPTGQPGPHAAQPSKSAGGDGADENAAPRYTTEACGVGAGNAPPSSTGGGGPGGSSGSDKPKRRKRFEPHKDDRAASKAFYKQKAALVARAAALAASAPGAEVYVFIASGASGRSWQYATPRLAAAAAGLGVLEEGAAAVVTGEGGETGGGQPAGPACPLPPDLQGPLLTPAAGPRDCAVAATGGALPALLRRATGAAAGGLPPWPAPTTDTMPDPPGAPTGHDPALGLGREEGGRGLPPAESAGGGRGGGDSSAGEEEEGRSDPQQGRPPPDHRPWPGGATLVAGADGHPQLVLVGSGGVVEHMAPPGF